MVWNRCVFGAVSTESHERRIKEQERRLNSLASQYIQQQAKLDDSEAHSCQQNIHIIGINEKAEDVCPTDFVAILLPKLLGEDHFNWPIEIDCVHQSLGPAKEGYYSQAALLSAGA